MCPGVDVLCCGLVVVVRAVGSVVVRVCVYVLRILVCLCVFLLVNDLCLTVSVRRLRRRPLTWHFRFLLLCEIISAYRMICVIYLKAGSPYR